MQHRVKYPFHRAEVKVFRDGEEIKIESWVPGIRQELRGCSSAWSEHCIADGEGEMILTEISRHKPGKYPERVFYTRRFVDPDGKEFGKTKLRIIAGTRFKQLCAGYNYYGEDYELAPRPAPTPPEECPF